jgi:hypothetical protein
MIMFGLIVLQLVLFEEKFSVVKEHSRLLCNVYCSTNTNTNTNNNNNNNNNNVNNNVNNGISIINTYEL